jgi:Amt family ammonium transporter
MTPNSAVPLSDLATALCVIFILLVPVAAAGLALINTGLGRSRSAAHAILASLVVISVAAVVYFVFGFSLQGIAGGPAHSATLSGHRWNLLAVQPWFMRGLKFDGSFASLQAWLGMLSVGLAALIPLGSGGDRWRLGACCASTAILAAITYPIFAHWVWGGGWLAQLGAFYGLGRGFQDAGGTAAIQVVGGFTALSIAWILGPRRGKYAVDGMPAAIPGHNVVYIVFGCILALVGWCALNAAGAILYAGVPAGSAVLIAVNTTLSAAAAMLAALVVTRVRFGKPDASLCANGWVGGLVASSAAAPFIPPAGALVVGLVAGTIVPLSVEWLDLRFAVDDPSGAVSVHAAAGLWGLLALGLLARFPDAAHAGATAAPGQWLAQIIGIATLLGFVLPVTYLLNWFLNRFLPQRVAREGERQGLDLYELGAGAYPEFLTHSDEFLQR